jgi:hypothetical protein
MISSVGTGVRNSQFAADLSCELRNPEDPPENVILEWILDLKSRCALVHLWSHAPALSHRWRRSASGSMARSDTIEWRGQAMATQNQFVKTF